MKSFAESTAADGEDADLPHYMSTRDEKVHKIEPAWSDQYFAMPDVFERTGGTISGDDFSQLLRNRLDQPISKLARWIVDRDVLSFRWKSSVWLPLFQFPQSMTIVDPGIEPVLRELSDILDDWGLACWFTHPNPCLGGAVPTDVFLVDSREVLNAARAHRFVMKG